MNGAKFLSALAIAIAFAFVNNASAQVASASQSAPLSQIAPNSDLFFSSKAPIALTLSAPFAELFSHKKDSYDSRAIKKLKITGTLKHGATSVPVEIRMRGFSSLGTCSFPKLTIKLSKKLSVGTIFENVGKLDLSTHCDAEDGMKSFMRAMEFAHREALLYHWLEILEIPAYASRMAEMTYEDTSEKTPLKTITRPAFFIENLSSFLKRANGIEIRAVNDTQHGVAPDNEEHRAAYTNLPDHAEIDRTQLARISLFQSMIGNYDYRLYQDEIWNLKLIELKDGRWFPIPLDFNLSNVTMGRPSYGFETSDFFNAVSNDERLKIISQFESKKIELQKSVAAIESNSEGAKSFRTTLESTFESLKQLKEQLAAEPKPEQTETKKADLP